MTNQDKCNRVLKYLIYCLEHNVDSSELRGKLMENINKHTTSPIDSKITISELIFRVSGYTPSFRYQLFSNFQPEELKVTNIID